MLNRSASLAMSTCVLKALPGKLDIKRHSPSILYLLTPKCWNNVPNYIVQIIVIKLFDSYKDILLKLKSFELVYIYFLS